MLEDSSVAETSTEATLEVEPQRNPLFDTSSTPASYSNIVVGELSRDTALDVEEQGALQRSIVESNRELLRAGCRYSIVGTWSNWIPEEMGWDGDCFYYVVEIGTNMWEAFQILHNGSWEARIYPSVRNANPAMNYEFRGPDSGGKGYDWMIGHNMGPFTTFFGKNQFTPGTKYKVMLFVDPMGTIVRLTWEQHANANLSKASRGKHAWMWGDSSIIGHGIAQMNPLRWSRSMSPCEIVKELHGYEQKGVQRPVLIALDLSGSTEKRRYPEIADAIVDMQNLMQEGIETVCGEHFVRSEVANPTSVHHDGRANLQESLSPAGISEAGGSFPFPHDNKHDYIVDDGITQLLLAGGHEALLGQWLQQGQRLQQELAFISLRDDSVRPDSTYDAFEVSRDANIEIEICRGIHKTLVDMTAADQLESILASETQLQSAPLFLHFLVKKVRMAEGGLRATLAKDLAILLGITGWRQVFEKQGLFHALPDDCRYILASDGVHLGRGTADGTYDGSSEHENQVKTIVQHALHQASSSLVRAGARIVILGDRGAGKSSICNAAFGNVVAAAGAGRSVTTGIALYEATEACPVHIYDTKGFETLCDNDDALSQLKSLVEERRLEVSQYAPDDPAAVTEHLHAIWWVIDVIGGGRFNPTSIESVARLFSETGVPIIMVLNKCDVEETYVREVERSVREHCLWAHDVVRVVAVPRMGPLAQLCEECGSTDIVINCKRMYYNCESCRRMHVPFKRSYGFDELVKVTTQCLPKMVLASFVSAQKVWLEGLDKAALRDVCGCAAVAGGMGAAPLPFLTRLALFPLQAAMVVKLASLYGVVVSWKAALHIVCSIGVVSTVGLLGWGAATTLKLLPGLCAVGMLSDACISAAFTIAIGLVVRTMLRRVRSKAAAVDMEVTPEDLAEFMSIDERRSLFTDYFNRLRAPLMELMQDASAVSLETLERTVSAVYYEVSIPS